MNLWEKQAPSRVQKPAAEVAPAPAEKPAKKAAKKAAK
jgi:hypothetical protein